MFVLPHISFLNHTLAVAFFYLNQLPQLVLRRFYSYIIVECVRVQGEKRGYLHSSLPTYTGVTCKSSIHRVVVVQGVLYHTEVWL